MAKVDVKKKILSENDRMAAENRARFGEAGVLVLNLISSPGSGKTTLLEGTLDRLAGQVRVLVIEGDVSTDRDIERVKAHGAGGVQINTGGGCHLSAKMVAGVMPELDLDEADVVFIENVGNLICPSTYDLGEDAKVVLLSTTEGDDKPMKYPAIFHESSVAVINKIDLVEYLPYDPARAEKEIGVLNESCDVLRLSALKGEGMDEWIEWILRRLEEKRAAREEAPA
ncbi:MAG: hydrogenase nickel incorporation protein HypB [Candidatus Eisenbacteria bacterium]|nr:hydrogenase nickel incorporation protein HypB [Candidatus Eisenbacteria bacterium]